MSGARQPAAVPQVAAIMLTWNHWPATERVLQDLTAQDYGALTIIVVDNGSTDGTPARIAAQFPRVTLLVNETNRGFAAAANQGAAVATDSAYLWFLNNDLRVDTDVLTRLIGVLDRAPDVAALSPVIIDRGRPPHAESGGFAHPLTLECQRLPAERGAESPIAVDYLFGTALLVRAEAFRAAGGFDDSFFFYYEDMDLSRRLRQLGHRLWVVPSVRLSHEGGGSTVDQLQMRYYLKSRASVHFFRKHAGRRWPLIVLTRAASALLTTGRLLRRGRVRAMEAHWKGLWDGLRRPINE
ncbi:MAG: glycosyltransferase family 2 protein [Anaerolineales bacterium]|nr:glycosyltransferase family 2 protein [Anaerolineales bacterium]MCB9127410.1 glycosyltransferase family 2 protein [Ardenticatenales bacterium]